MREGEAIDPLRVLDEKARREAFLQPVEKILRGELADRRKELDRDPVAEDGHGSNDTNHGRGSIAQRGDRRSRTPTGAIDRERPLDVLVELRDVVVEVAQQLTYEQVDCRR